MDAVSSAFQIPLTGAIWAAKSEAYASLVSSHLSPQTVWVDAGCGSRLLEDDLDPLENWLATRCRMVIGVDVSLTSHRNVQLLVQGSLYDMPFADGSLDLVTCRMVVEHLEHPAKGFTEVARCLRPGGAIIVATPNLLNYGILGNAIVARSIPEKWRLWLVHKSDSRSAEDIFPVRYAANTMRRLVRLLAESGLQVHQATGIRQRRPYWPNSGKLESVLMKLTPICGLLVCAHKVAVQKTS
jgi:SAM-dependent methyltransferase